MTENIEKKTLGIAIASLVFGCLFIVPFLGVVFGLTAIILGIVALIKIGDNKDTFKGSGFAISGIVLGGLGVIMIPVMILSAIAIPNFIRMKIKANETAAVERIRKVSLAAESYFAANNNRYPDDESALIYATPPYLEESCGNKTIQGYTYSLNFGPDSYEIIATPQHCKSSGNKVFTIKDSQLSEIPCNR